MFSRRVGRIAIPLAALFSFQYSEACSLGSTSAAFDDARVVLLGQVTNHLEQDVYGRVAFGFTISPVRIFSQIDESDVPKFKFFPTALGTDCSSLTVAPSRQLIERYSVGKLIAIYAKPFENANPDDFFLTELRNFELINDSCELGSVGKPSAPWPRDQLCGSADFRAQALISALPFATGQTVDESLVRLASYPGWIRYKELIRQFTTLESRARELLELRYGELINDSCLDEEYEYPEKSIKTFLRKEYCHL